MPKAPYDGNNTIICTAYDQIGNNYDGNDTTSTCIYDNQDPTATNNEYKYDWLNRLILTSTTP